MELTEEVRQALTSGHLAHLVTLEPDGGPQVTLVWVGLDDHEIVAGHLGVWRKVANMRRDPRVVLSMETGGISSNGLAEYLIVHGTARITEGRAPELLQRLAGVYLGPDVKFPPMDDPPPGYVTRITPERSAGSVPGRAEARRPGGRSQAHHEARPRPAPSSRHRAALFPRESLAGGLLQRWRAWPLATGEDRTTWQNESEGALASAHV